MNYVYLLERDGKLYIGYTNDLKRRYKQHCQNHKCVLFYYEAYLTEKMARDRELKLKQYGSAWQGLKKRILSERAGSLFSKTRSTHQENI